MPITQWPGRPLDPTVAVAGEAGRELERPPARQRETLLVALPTGQLLSGPGVASLLFSAGAGMWKPDPPPAVAAGWGAGHTPQNGGGGHQTCQAGLPCGVRRRPACHTPRIQTPQLQPPLPKPETRGLTSKLTLDTFSQSAPAPTGQHRSNNAPQARAPWGGLPNHTL